MTLFKQLALVVAMIIIVMLGAVMYINYTSAKQDMIDGLYETTVNNISTLSSKLADASGDKALTSTLIDAEFDGGYYKLIAFTSNDGTFSYKQEDNEKVENVPVWFINFTNIKLEKVTADVSSGWNMVGEVSVLGDTGVIYKALYAMFIKLLYLFMFFVSISLLLLSILLHFVLKPLKLIQNQAEAILKNEFVIQEGEPYTTEFKGVVKGMNLMVKKVEDIFNKANESAKRNHELLYTEQITGLYNRRYMMLKLPKLISQNNKIDGGVTFFIGLSSIEVMNQLISRREANNLIIAFCEAFDSLTQKFDDRLLCRLNEMEFLFVLSECEVDEAKEIVKGVNHAFEELLAKYKISLENVHINIGLYHYNSSISMGELLTRADTALSNAIANELDNTFVYEEKDDENTLAKEQWRSIIEFAIKEKKIKFEYTSAVKLSNESIIHETLEYTLYDSDRKEYLFKDFIAPVINLGLSTKMYITLLDLLLQKDSQSEHKRVTLKMPNDFFRDENTLGLLQKLFSQHSKSKKIALSFEIDDNFVIKNRALVKIFTTMFEKYGYGFGIHSFSGESNDYAYLKELNPSFIKADSSFLLDQSEDSMGALFVITDALGIKVIATQVATQEQIASLEALHIETVQGNIV